MKVVRNCLLLATAITAALAGVGHATAAPAAAPVGTITESRVSGNGLNRVTLGPDDKLWFTECGATSSIGRIDPAQIGQQDPAVSHFPTPTPGSCPIDITTGPGGDLWFTEFGGNIGRITTAGAITEFPVPGSPPLFGIIAPPGRIRRSSAIATMPSSITGSVAATVVSRTGSASSPSRIMSPAAPQLNCPVTVFTPTCSRWMTRTSKPIPLRVSAGSTVLS